MDNSEVLKNIDKMLKSDLPKKVREDLERKKVALINNQSIKK